jgi:hypothetical protein
VVKDSAARVSQAMAHAHVPYDRVYELVAEENVRVVAELNFLDNAPRSCHTKRDRYAVNAAPTDWARAGSDSYLRVYEWADGITLALQALDAVMDADAVEHFLRGYARLVEAHRDPGTDLRVSEAAALIGFTPAKPRTTAPTEPERTGTAPAERVLVDVVAEVNGLDGVDPARSYLGAGGRVLRLPRVVEALHERGWRTGLVPFTTARPLSALAHELVPARG